jgi:C4-type Zn-finger protein
MNSLKKTPFSECPNCQSKNVKIGRKQKVIVNKITDLFFWFTCLDCGYKKKELVPLSRT